jgi:hypothetical protein
MMRSWRIFFSRGIPKQNFEIRRFNSHHQFHSFFHLDDHHSFYDHHQWSINTSRTASFSLTQQRFQTTNIIRGAESTSLGIDEQLQRLKDNVKKQEFDQFVNHMDQLSRTAAALTQNQNQQLISTLKEWNQDDHSDREYAYILKSLANLKFSVTIREQRDIVVAIVDSSLAKGHLSSRWFALFLSGLRRLKYSGSLLNEKHRQRIVRSLGELKDDMHEKAYAELLSGLVGLGIHWNEISEAGKGNLHNRLEVLKSKLTADVIYSVLFNFGKLEVNLKESPYKKTILELTARALKTIERDNGQGKLDLPRVVSTITKYSDLLLESYMFIRLAIWSKDWQTLVL